MMKTTMKSIGTGLLLSALTPGGPATQSCAAASFGDDVAFLSKHTKVIILTDRGGESKVALVPAWQGRIMTSTAAGDAGPSFGWINRELVSSGKFQQHINVFGGEDRFWLGPEGGQYSIFFSKNVAFDLEHWFTPAPIDTLPFEVVSQAANKAKFQSAFSVTNYSGTRFELKVDREVELLPPGAAWKTFQIKPAKGARMVAFESVNKITNTGKEAWKKEAGLLSIWILGMFNPSDATTIVVPINAGAEAQLGTKVTSDYFGAIPPDRLVVKDEVMFFSGDGKFRSKIGINPKRSKSILGSYDAANKVLTLVRFNQPAGVSDYVNSLWKLQDKPFGGDAINSYNDGPSAPGAKPLGPFYELETSSPAAALAPGKSLQHTHSTIHLTGSEPALDAVARAKLGVSLEQIKNALPKKAK